MKSNFLYFDIETHTPNGVPDPAIDQCVCVGFKSQGRKKIFWEPEDHNAIQRSINWADYVIGHNIINYDIPILQRHEYRFDDKIIVDTYDIMEKRAKPVMYLDLQKGEKSLDSLCKRFNLSYTKKDIDYSIFADPLQIAANRVKIEEYLEGDLDAGMALFEHLYGFFSGFKELMSKRDQEQLSWLLLPIGVTAYKAFCHLTGLKEEYNYDVDYANKAYEGAYVSTPYIDFIKGDD